MQQSTLSIPASKYRAHVAKAVEDPPKAMGPAGARDAGRKMHGDHIGEGWANAAFSKSWGPSPGVRMTGENLETPFHG